MHVLDRGVLHGEEQSISAHPREREQQWNPRKSSQSQLPPTTKQAGRTEYWHESAEREGSKRFNSFHPGIR